MLHETVDDWGLTPMAYARREKARLREKIRTRVERERNSRWHFVAAAPAPAPILGRVFIADGIKAYTEDQERSYLISGARSLPTRVSLPYISIQHGEG